MVPREYTAFLAASAPRTRLLQYLRQYSGCPSELAANLSASRRGVQRNLTKFAEKDWAAKTNGEYHLTAVGTLIAQRYDSFLDNLNDIIEIEPLFRHLPKHLSIPDPQWFRNAMIVTAENTPYAPAAQYARWLSEVPTETLQGILPVVDRLSIGAVRELIIERDIYVDIVGSPAVIEALPTLDSIRNVSKSNSVVLCEYKKLVGMGLCLTGDACFLSVYDDRGHMRACVKCAHPAFRRWIEEVYKHVRKHAQSVTLSI